MNRRSLLALIGGAFVTPTTTTAKTVAPLLGIRDYPATSTDILGPCAPISGPSMFWGSPTQIKMDTARAARIDMAQGTRYAHMKSWGAGFRHSVISRDLIIERAFERKCEVEEDFFEKVTEALK